MMMEYRWPGEEDQPIIVLNNVSLCYEDQSAAVLEEIDFKLSAGEFVCLLGPSGCGKSSLLKIVAGFTMPTAGEAEMDGRPILGADWRRGVVFQQPPLYPWLNVSDNIKFGLKMRCLPLAERSVLTTEYLRKVGLQEFADSRTYELSGGMKQRVALARAIVNRPRVLLMDEPFGALDALTREQMQNLLRNIWWETRCAILFITHDVDEALLLGTRILVMSKRPGRIVRQFHAGFTNGIAADDFGRTRYSGEFLKMREQILQLINAQQFDYRI